MSAQHVSSSKYGTTKSQVELTTDHDKTLNINLHRLEILISEISVSFDEKTKAEFDIAQKAWELYAQTWARFQSFRSYGGSIGPMLYSDAMTKLVKQRLQQLKSIVGLEQAVHELRP